MKVELTKELFDELIRPSNLFRDWTGKEFSDYCKRGCLRSLKMLMIELEKEEMFEFCAILRDVIKDKKV